MGEGGLASGLKSESHDNKNSTMMQGSSQSENPFTSFKAVGNTQNIILRILFVDKL
jgi:hypothetical protein